MNNYSAPLSRLIPVLAGCFGVFLASLMSFQSLSGDPADCVFALVITLLIFAGGCIWLLRRPFAAKPSTKMYCVVLLFIGLFLRLSLFDHISGDYVSFLSVWTESMRNMTVGEALSTPIGDYNMPYLYLILIVSRLPFYDLYCIKLFSVIADVAAAIAIGKLASLKTKNDNLLLLAFAAALFAPTTWLNSAYWGQCDSIYGAFALWALYCGLRHRSVASILLFSMAFAFKLQTIFILPIVAFLLVGKYLRPVHLLFFPAGFVAASLPAILGGRSFSDTFSIYVSQTSSYPLLTLNAPSFWSLIDNEYFSALSAAPVLLAMTAVLLLVWLFLRHTGKMDSGDLIALALIFSLCIPWFLPRMHERYFYLAEMLSIVYAAIHPRRFPVALVLLFGGFLIYSAYLFGKVPVFSMGFVAIAYGATLIYLFCCSAKSLGIITKRK